MSNSLMNKQDWNSGDTGYVAVFNPDTNLPIGEMLKYDLNALMPSSGGASVERIIHTKLKMIVVGGSFANSSFIGISGRFGNKSLGDGTSDGLPNEDISEDYFDSYWDFYNGAGDLIGKKQQFTTVADVYAYLQTIVLNDGANYTDSCDAVVYDEINNSILPIEKVYGYNEFLRNILSNNKGTRFDRNESTWLDKNITLIEELYDNTGINPGHVYSAGDEAIVKVTRNKISWYSGIHTSHAVAYDINNLSAVWRTIDNTLATNRANTFTQDYGMSKYCAKSIGNNSWEWVNWHDVLRLNDLLLDPYISVIAFYVFNTGNDYTVVAKPVNVDVVILDYFDITKYDLYKVTTGRDRWTDFTKIDKSTLSQKHLLNSTKLLPSNYYDNQFGFKHWGKYSTKTNFNFRFVLRDLETNELSPMTKSKINWSSIPQRNNVVSCKIENS